MKRATERIALACLSRHWVYVEPGSVGYATAKCKGARCRLSDGSAVEHRFDLSDGSFKTRMITEPDKAQEDG